MPYKDPEKQRVAHRTAQRRYRARRLAEDVQKAADLAVLPSRDVLLRVLGVQALEGNVPAIRLLLEEYRRDGERIKTPTDTIDEFASRRAARVG